MSQAPSGTNVTRVECRAANDPAVRLFIVAGMLIAFAVWCFIERGKYPPPEAWDLSHINKASSYVLNNFGPYVFGPVGVVFGVWGVVFLRRVLVADEEGIGYAGKRKILWAQVTKLDAALLKNKGLLYLHHGDRGRLVLDSWKLRDFRDLVAFVEKKVNPELLKA